MGRADRDTGENQRNGPAVPRPPPARPPADQSLPSFDRTGNPLWQAIPSVQAGHAVVLDDQDMANAFSSGLPLGIRYALENAVPLFAGALG